MTTPNQAVQPPNFIQRTLIVIGLVTAVALVILFAWQILDILVLLFAGILLGVFLTSISGWIREHTPLSHRQSLGVTVIGLLIITSLAIWLAAPSLITQGRQLGSNLDASIENVQDTLDHLDWTQPLLSRLPNLSQLSSSSSSLLSQGLGIFSMTFNMFTNVVVIVFIGFYLAFEPDKYTNGLIRLAPKSYRRRAGKVLDEVAYTLRWWLIGRFSSMAVVGALSIIGLIILGIPLAFILGVLAGLLAFIPIIGPDLALIPPTLLAFTISPQKALYVFLLYMGIQILESYFITPIIQRKAVALPPVMLILAQVILAVFLGFMGVAVAAPLAAVVIVLTKMLYVDDVLGDSPELLKDNPQPHFAASKPSSAD